MWCPRSSRFWDAERILEQRHWGRNKMTKNETVLGTSPPSRCFTRISQRLFWDWSPLELRKTGECQNCIRGRLWTLVQCVDPFWLHVKTFENSCQHHLQNIWQGEENIASKRITHIEYGQKRKRAQSQLNHVSFVWEPRAVTFKLLLLTETIIGLKPLCM